jgi:hypothetical protein
MRIDDYYPAGKRWWVRLLEKGGKRHEIPAHHNLETYIDEYLDAAGIRDDGKGHLFRPPRRRPHRGPDAPHRRLPDGSPACRRCVACHAAGKRRLTPRE